MHRLHIKTEHIEANATCLVESPHNFFVSFPVNISVDKPNLYKVALICLVISPQFFVFISCKKIFNGIMAMGLPPSSPVGKIPDEKLIINKWWP